MGTPFLQPGRPQPIAEHALQQVLFTKQALALSTSAFAALQLMTGQDFLEGPALLLYPGHAEIESNAKPGFTHWTTPLDGFTDGVIVADALAEGFLLPALMAEHKPALIFALHIDEGFSLDLEELAFMAKELYPTIPFLADVSASLGETPFYTDDWRLDGACCRRDSIYLSTATVAPGTLLELPEAFEPFTELGEPGAIQQRWQQLHSKC